MTTEKLIEIAGSALCDTLCEGCETEENNEILGSCFECRVQALKEIADRLNRSIVLGKQYPVSDFTMTLSKGTNNEHMFSIGRLKG